MNVRIMADSPIRFPGLFGDWAFTGSSVAFHIGGKAIYWYGIIIALGVLLALWFCMKQKEKYGITEDNLIDGVLWGIPLAIVGARLYYVLFYLDRFKKADGSFDWAESVAIWDGGLAIYGGVIAAPVFKAVTSRVMAYHGSLPDPGALTPAQIKAREKAEARARAERRGNKEKTVLLKDATAQAIEEYLTNVELE